MLEVLLDLKDYFPDFIVNVIASFFFTLIVLRIERIWQRKSMRKRFSRIAGKYIGYGYDDLAAKIHDKPQSEATIIYESKNILKIHLKHTVGDLLEWQGTIIMSLEYEETGMIVWGYKTFDRFGFKRCIYDRKNHWFYLIGEKSEGFGNEILKPAL